MSQYTISARHRKYLRVLGNKCREHRVFIGYSQKDVAEEIGVVPSIISLFENGQANNAIALSWYVKKGLKISSVYNELEETV